MVSVVKRYMNWLHTRWPAGGVEKLPECDECGRTNVPGLWIAGDLKGIPLLKFSSLSGVRAVQDILSDQEFTAHRDDSSIDLAIIGGGISGISAAIEARKAGINFQVFESAQPFATIANFPKAKPIYTYPTELKLDHGLQFHADIKESLLEELETQRRDNGIEVRTERITRVERSKGEFLLHTAGGNENPVRARRVLVAIGRNGDFRKLNVPGENRDGVYNRLHDPKDFAGRHALVVGGGDSALETAIALAGCGAQVTLSYRRNEFARPKPDNVARLKELERDPAANVRVEHPVSERVTTGMPEGMRPAGVMGSLRVLLGSEVERIGEKSIRIRDASGAVQELPNDVVFTMIGREAPLDFFRRSGVTIRGEWKARTYLGCALFVLFIVLLAHWKSSRIEFPLRKTVAAAGGFPFNVPAAIDHAGGWLSAAANHESNLLFTLKRGLGNPSFYYTLVYSLCVFGFGLRRMRRSNTPYVRWQTWTLIAIQCIPLFILPEIILPWAGRNGWFESDKPLRWLADQLFESYDGSIGHERAYWRSYGFILAFPLNVYTVFAQQPMWLWLGISFVQTFVIIPLLIWRWGKGAYCGWICSCGALAETLGDAYRHKMPHGPGWNRLNMVGQGVLAFAFGILFLRIAGWIAGPESTPARWANALFENIPYLNYSWSVDILMSSILGVGLYFWFSGRVWCRFACPLAALMHIYARFSRYRIFAEKSKCISCNVCTSVCHQGIDVMSFANKGLPMEDPECVRCSACVQQCPTGVLSFGRYDGNKRVVLDKLPASPVQMRESESA